jgi:hypothetical protein
MSHRIQEIPYFTIKGTNQIFSSEAKCIEWLSDRLGRAIDEMTGNVSEPLSPKQKLQIHDFMLKNREKLVEILNF